MFSLETPGHQLPQSALRDQGIVCVRSTGARSLKTREHWHEGIDGSLDLDSFCLFCGTTDPRKAAPVCIPLRLKSLDVEFELFERGVLF
jgi:hypothetical protein